MKGTAIINACLQIIFVSLLFQTAACQKVKITFYYINLEEWNEDGSTATLKSTLTNEANRYCADNVAACGLNEWLPAAVFRTTGVLIADGFPAQVKSNIVVELTIWMNAFMNRSDPGQSYLSNEALKAIIRNSRDSLRENTESWIIYIGDDHISPPPPRRANEILIPVAFAVLVAIIIIAVSLHCWRKHKDATDKQMAVKTSGKSRVSPSSDGDKSSIQMVHPPSRKQGRTFHGSSDVTATPSSITMTTDATDGTKYDSVNEGKRRHKKRHRKKKHQDDNPESQPDQLDNYTSNYHRFADVQDDRIINENGEPRRIFEKL